jgi:signal transduction histidine kinase
MSSLQTRVLRIKTELSQSNTVHVSIEDTGTGIKSSDVARLFQPMFTTKTRGMGMGLSICLSINESHGGRIWVSPRANGGSIFQFEVPTVGSKDQAARIGVVRSVSALSGVKRRRRGRSGAAFAMS